jgi:nucleoside-diphosphate-sugar epimerase
MFFSPPPKEMMEPAVTGTRHVLNACSQVKVKKVIVVSSILAKGSSDE